MQFFFAVYLGRWTGLGVIEWCWNWKFGKIFCAEWNSNSYDPNRSLSSIHLCWYIWLLSANCNQPFSVSNSDSVDSHLEHTLRSTYRHLRSLFVAVTVRENWKSGKRNENSRNSKHKIRCNELVDDFQNITRRQCSWFFHTIHTTIQSFSFFFLIRPSLYRLIFTALIVITATH